MRWLFVCLLPVLLAAPLFAQSPDYLQLADSSEFSDQWLVMPLEILPDDQVPGGTFARAERDLLLCTGPRFLPGAAPLDVAEQNNAAVRRLQAAGLDQRAEWEAVLTVFEAGLADDPQFLPFLYNAGRVAFWLGRRETAVAYFERARNLLPEFAGIHVNLGRLYASGRPGEREVHAALASLRNAARLNPFERSAWLALGDVYAERGDHRRAREYYNAVLRDIPDSIPAQVALARLALHAEEYNQARRILERTKLDYPGGRTRDASAHAALYYLGLAYRALGAHAQAVRAFDRVLAVPNDALFIWISYDALQRLRDQSAATSRASG